MLKEARDTVRQLRQAAPPPPTVVQVLPKDVALMQEQARHAETREKFLGVLVRTETTSLARFELFLHAGVSCGHDLDDFFVVGDVVAASIERGARGGGVFSAVVFSAVVGGFSFGFL